MDGWNAHCRAFTVSNWTPVLIVDLNARDSLIFPGKAQKTDSGDFRKENGFKYIRLFQLWRPTPPFPTPTSNPQKEKVSSKRIVGMGLFLCA